MCEKCDLNEYAAELSTEKWLKAVRDTDEMSTALEEARYQLARDEQVIADVRAIAEMANELEFHQLRGLLARISKRVGGVADTLDARAG